MRHGGHEDGHAQARRNLQAAGNKPPRNFVFFLFFTPLLLLYLIVLKMMCV
jgi:hypothetical protein